MPFPILPIIASLIASYIGGEVGGAAGKALGKGKVPPEAEAEIKAIIEREAAKRAAEQGIKIPDAMKQMNAELRPGLEDERRVGGIPWLEDAGAIAGSLVGGGAGALATKAGRAGAKALMTKAGMLKGKPTASTPASGPSKVGDVDDVATKIHDPEVLPNESVGSQPLGLPFTPQPREFKMPGPSREFPRGRAPSRSDGPIEMGLDQPLLGMTQRRVPTGRAPSPGGDAIEMPLNQPLLGMTPREVRTGRAPSPGGAPIELEGGGMRRQSRWSEYDMDAMENPGAFSDAEAADAAAFDALMERTMPRRQRPDLRTRLMSMTGD